MVRVFGQAFYEQNCDHADHVVAGVFGQAFFEKGCRQDIF